MRIATKVVISIETGEVLKWEGFEYVGPLALCGRSESKQVVNQGTSQSAQNAQQGATAFGAGMGALSNYENQVAKFQADNPFKIGGDFDTSQRTINANSSTAGTNALRQQMALNAQRTGQNAASYAPSLAEAQRTAARDQATAEAKAEQQRIGSEAAYNSEGVQMAGLAPDMASRLYGSSVSGTTGNLSAAGNAARTPGFFDTFLPALAQGAGSAAGGWFAGGNCWIAEAVYGREDGRTHLVRAWLNREFVKKPVGKLVMAVYGVCGRQVAAIVRRSKFLQASLRPLFDIALTRATRCAA